MIRDHAAIRTSIVGAILMFVPASAWAATECTGSFDDWDCFATTLGIVAPLAVVTWLVALMIAAAVLESPRDHLGAVAGFLTILTPVTLIAIVSMFEALDTAGLWELLVGPALVFGQALLVARWREAPR